MNPLFSAFLKKTRPGSQSLLEIIVHSINSLYFIMPEESDMPPGRLLHQTDGPVYRYEGITR